MTKFNITSIKPCADYDGSTYEGTVYSDCDRTLMQTNLSNIADLYYEVGQGKILYAKISTCEFYLYDTGNFILSKATCEEEAVKLLKQIIGRNDAEET